MLFDKGGIDCDFIACAVGCIEGQVLEHTLDHGVKAARADVFDGFVHFGGDLGQCFDAVFGEGHCDPFSLHECCILQGQRIVCFGQDAHEIVLGQCAQFNADWQAALQFGQQIRGFRHMERTRGDEQDMVGFDRPVFGRYGCTFDQRQQVTLHTFAGNVGPACVGPCADLVDLVQKHDSVLFNRLKCCFRDDLIVEQFVRLIRDQRVIAIGDGHLFFDRPAAHCFSEQIAKVHHATHAPGLPRDFETAHGVGCVGQFKLDDRVIQIA